MEPDAPVRARPISRRRLVSGAAWTTPVVLTAAAAPAYAASGPCSTVPAPSTANGWTTVSTGMTTNGGANGFNANDGYTLLADPQVSVAGTVTVTSPQRTFYTTRTYTFTFSYTNYASNPRNLQMNFLVAGAAQANGYLNTDTTTPLTGSRTITYTPTADVTGSVVLSFRFDNGSGTAGDDITITNFTSSCA